jgi:hypothetical protein
MFVHCTLKGEILQELKHLVSVLMRVNSKQLDIQYTVYGRQ